MALKRRRENDETRKLPDMGKALGWDTLGSHPRQGNAITQMDKSMGMVYTAKPHVKEKTGAVVKESNAGFNERENRRVQGIKDGSSARRKMAWDEIQNKSDSPAPVVKIDSGKK
jgi:hypothetical protein